MKYSSEDQKVINKWLTSVGAKHLVDEEFFLSIEMGSYLRLQNLE